MGVVRFLLAISVLSIHTDYNLGLSRFGEALAVNTFFIISGFYMALILTEKYVGRNGSYRLFITNRFLRIYPVYWVILASTILIATLHSSRLPYSSLAGVISDVTLLARTDYLSINAATTNTPLVTPAWTLIVELTFYLFAVFFVRLKTRYIIGIAVLSFVVRYGIAYYEMLHHTYQKTGFLPACLVFFMLGILSYRLYSRLKLKQLDRRLTVSLLIIMVLLTVFYYQIPSIISYHRFELKEWLYYISFTAFAPFCFLLLRSNAIDRFIGELSYPIHIAHFLVVDILVNYLKIGSGTWYVFVMASAVTIIVSLVLVQCIDKPIDRYRQKRLHRGVTAAAPANVATGLGDHPPEVR